MKKYAIKNVTGIFCWDCGCRHDYVTSGCRVIVSDERGAFKSSLIPNGMFFAVEVFENSEGLEEVELLDWLREFIEAVSEL